MRAVIARPAVMFLIVYASLYGGVVETHPIVKIVHQLGSTLLIALWLGDLLVRERPFPVTRMDGPLWALGVGWLAAALFGESPRISLEFLWATYVHLMLFFMFVDIIRSGHQRWLFEGLFLTGGIIVLLGAGEMILWYLGFTLADGMGPSWPDVGGYSVPPVIHELSLPLNHNNPTGAYTVILLPLVLAWSSTTCQTDLKWGLRALAVALVSVLILTQSRGAYLAFAALVGFMMLLWLLRSETRARFPHWLQPYLAPHVVLTAAVCGVIGAVLILYRIIVQPSHPNPNDVVRLDLWYSAVRIFEDHPILGVGPYQFKAVRLAYANWELSQTYLVLDHAHNLAFNILAEGGTVMVTLTLWVLVRAARIWWAAWTRVSGSIRRRLEGILAAALAFAVHNMVDAFLQTQLVIPLAILLATIAAHDRLPAPGAVSRSRNLIPSRIRWGLAGTALIMGQLAFVPLLLGLVNQQQFLTLMTQERRIEALDKVRQARATDPWQDLYSAEAAVVMGELAAEDPDTYLTDAIAAFEASLDRYALWDGGWHSLAALYAQGGDYARAVQAELRAYQISPRHSAHHLKLGEYYELAGDWDSASRIYLETLEDHPWLASSDFWRDPAYARRTELLNATVEPIAGTATGIDLAFFSGAFESIPKTIDGAPDAVQRRLHALWPSDNPTPCVYCYYVLDNPLLLEAETLLHTKPITPELVDRVNRLAREAIFVGAVKSEWGWYVLVRLTEHIPLTARQIEQYLSRATVFPADYRTEFATVSRSQGRLDIIPQAREPRMSAIAYEPWLRLAAWHTEHGDLAAAYECYRLVERADPYSLSVAEHIAGLMPASTPPDG